MTIKSQLLIEQLFEIPGIIGLAYELAIRETAINATWHAKGIGFVRVDWEEIPSQEIIDSVNVIIDNHDPADLSQEEITVINQDTVLEWLRNSPLADMNPQEVYNAVQNQIDGWTSLADAKESFREWEPVLWAVVMWLVRNR